MFKQTTTFLSVPDLPQKGFIMFHSKTPHAGNPKLCVLTKARSFLEEPRAKFILALIAGVFFVSVSSADFVVYGNVKFGGGGAIAPKPLPNATVNIYESGRLIGRGISRSDGTYIIKCRTTHTTRKINIHTMDIRYQVHYKAWNWFGIDTTPKGLGSSSHKLF